MPYWWEKYSSTPDDNNSAPPDGAPENHFPDQVNNIQRQAMASISEAFALIFKPDTVSGPPPITALPANAITDAFRQQIYNDQWPVGSIRAWVGGNGNALEAPSGITATWQICDGTNGAPDLRKKPIGGGDPADASPAYTGSVVGSGETSEDSAGTSSGTTDGHALTEAEMPIHTHGGTTDGHAHEMTFGDIPAGDTGQAYDQGTAKTDQTETAQDTFTTDPAGSGHEHTHDVTVSADGTHKHTVDVQITCLEFYMRTA